MNPHEADHLAVLVASEWIAGLATGGGDVEAAGDPDADELPPRVGAYWPLGSAVPVRRGLTRDRIQFIAAKALGTCLLFCFALDAVPHQYLLCLDLSETPADDFRVAAGSVFETVIGLISSPNWEGSLRGALPVSPAVTIVLPAK